MKVVIESEEIRMLLSMFVKNKLKCGIDFENSRFNVGDASYYLSGDFEFKLTIKKDEKEGKDA